MKLPWSGERRFRAAGMAAALALVSLGRAGASEPFVLDPSWPYTSNPAVAPELGGGFRAVWTREVQVPLPLGPDAFVPESVAVLGLTRSGMPIGAPRVALNRAIEGRPSLPQVTMHNALLGEVIWHRFLAGAFTIEGRLLAGPRFGPRTAIAECANGRLSTLRLAPTVAAGYWAMWTEACSRRRLVVQRLDRNGKPVLPIIVVASPQRQPGRLADFTGLVDGGFAAVWIEGGVSVVARVFGPDGRPRSPIFRVGPEPVADPPGSLPAATVAIAAAFDRLVVAWRSHDNQILVRAFRLNGAPVGPPRRAGIAEDTADERPRLACCARSEAVLSWRRLAGAAGESSCWLRRIGVDGRPHGPEALVAEDCSEAPIAVTEEGRVLALWAANIQQGDNHFRRVLARLLDVSDLN